MYTLCKDIHFEFVFFSNADSLVVITVRRGVPPVTHSPTPFFKSEAHQPIPIAFYLTFYTGMHATAEVV